MNLSSPVFRRAHTLFLSLVVVLVGSLALAACGDSSATSTNTVTTNRTPVAESTLATSNSCILSKEEAEKAVGPGVTIKQSTVCAYYQPRNIAGSPVDSMLLNVYIPYNNMDMASLKQTINSTGVATGPELKETNEFGLPGLITDDYSLVFVITKNKKVVQFTGRGDEKMKAFVAKAVEKL